VCHTAHYTDLKAWIACGKLWNNLKPMGLLVRDESAEIIVTSGSMLVLENVAFA